MRKEIIHYLDHHPDLRQFVRMNPKWYRELSRHPEKANELEQNADDFFGRSFSKRVERWGEQLGMINMLLELAQLAKEDNDAEVKKGADPS